MKTLPVVAKSGSVVGYARVDDDVFELLSIHTWRRHSRGYVCRSGATVLMHREIMGVTDPKVLVDHRDGDKLNNQRANLRLATVAENGQNRRAANRNSTSGIRGVRLRGGRWQARAWDGKRHLSLGWFDTSEEAAMVASDWRAKHMPFADPTHKEWVHMEGEDVFGGSEIGEDDPFAGTDFGDFDQPAPAAAPAPAEQRPAPEAAPTSEPPVVDKEGNPVAGAALPTLTPEQQAAEAARYRQEHGEPEPARSDPEEQQARLRAIHEREAQEKAQAETAPPTPQAGAIEDAPAAEQPQEAAQEAEEAAPAPEPIRPPLEPEADAIPAEPAGATGEDEPATEEGDASVPAEKKDKTGRVTHRRYLILRPEGNGKYTEVVWYENSKGEMVEKGARGAKRQKYALARGQEEALKIGYAAMGAPARATIVAVALSAFQSKVVEPETPKPSAIRLKIR